MNFIPDRRQTLRSRAVPALLALALTGCAAETNSTESCGASMCPEAPNP